MQFQIGEQVVHPVHGVGIVKTVSAQQFGTGPARQYYEVVTNGPTVWVPMDEQGATILLRKITSRQNLRECRILLSSDPLPLEANRKMRELEIASRLKGGLLPALCGMVRDLRARSSQAPLGQSDDRVLKRIFKALVEEWAASGGVSEHAALQEIEALLAEGRKSPLSQIDDKLKPHAPFKKEK